MLGTPAAADWTLTGLFFISFQVQDLEFAQIERKVIDGLKVGNECLKKMHEVSRVSVLSEGLTSAAAQRHDGDVVILPTGDVH